MCVHKKYYIDIQKYSESAYVKQVSFEDKFKISDSQHSDLK